MSKFISFKNLKEQNYRNLLIFFVLSNVVMQSLVYPSLEYLALSMKGDEHGFYSYATLGSVAGTIPLATSVIISYVVNNIRYKTLLISVICILLGISLIAILVQHNYIIYVLWVILSGILINALAFSIIRQTYALLADRFKDWQSDMMLFIAIGNIVGFKLSHLMYNWIAGQGLILVSIISTLIYFVFLRKIPAIDATFSDDESRSSAPHLGKVLKVLFRHKQFIVFLVIMLTIVLCGSGLVLFLTSTIYHNHLPNSVFANIMSVMASGGFIGALVSKSLKIQRLNSIYMLVISGFIFAICYGVVSLLKNSNMLYFICGTLGIVNVLFLVNMNTLFARFIINSKELFTIAPLINGFTTSCFYIVSLSGPFIFKYLLQASISYTIIMLAICIIDMLIMTVLFILHKLGFFSQSL